MLSRLISVLLLSVGAMLFLSGCSSSSQDESSIPWSRPAGWEGQAPGLGDISPGRNRY
ncbi:hypothetical protein [Rubellicoccus peritrichatus]|uniref:Lipoprotein n=1 Tax=Rubellicoccus peritrichatus TaxID=3080537 RepID=A0AAQ3QXD9_9BACT|nr:hypothetical protein [Puniceicoccus sp. CR14]WOO42765.1 hypothetical protein RZN69_06650 [Puniceicoccus sp. CR14]